MEVLVLNSFWAPISSTSAMRAIYKVFTDKAKFIGEDMCSYSWDEWISYSSKNPSENIIRGVNFFINKPVVIIQTRSKFSVKKVHPTRKNIFTRDKFTCQYCGSRPPRSSLTIDHIIPKSKGGKTTWINSVTCCPKCNNKKSDKSIKESGMNLISSPFEPNLANLFMNSIGENSSLRQYMEGLLC